MVKSVHADKEEDSFQDKQFAFKLQAFKTNSDSYRLHGDTGNDWSNGRNEYWWDISDESNIMMSSNYGPCFWSQWQQLVVLIKKFLACIVIE